MIKRIIALTLVAITVLVPVLSSCSNGGVSVSTTPQTTDKPAIPSNAEIYSWMSASYNKVAGNDRKPKELPKSFTLNAAKNEAESCHVTVRSNVDVTGLGFVLCEIV